MTVQELLDMTDDLYPNGETDAAKVSYMNIAIHTLAKYFGKVIEDATLVTVKDQDEYSYPAGIEDATQIISLAIARQATPYDRYDYRQYKLSRSEHDPKSYYSFHEIISDTGTKKFVLYPVPDEDDLTIVIRYNKIIPDLSASVLTASPEIDSRYHEALAFYAVHMICAKGASPDTTQANTYMQKFDAIEQALWKDSMEAKKAMKKKPRDNRQWHKSKSYGIGFEV